MTTATLTPVCLVCDTSFDVDPAWELGEILECAACGQEHELVEKSGTDLRVELAPEVEEDWGE